ncbi:MAG TPA: GNAT family N-acetyltransferase [Casimicrobiaceae bacterium]|nr:GNAT family N-acetyltransferase [Casimicrobiaceae bacterium]
MSAGCSTEFSACAPDDAEWRALAAELLPASRFVSAAWIKAWGQSFLPHQNWLPPLRYLTVRAADRRLLAVFPLATQKQAGFAVASLGGFYWPFRSPVIPENAGSEAMAALASAFTASRDIAALRYGPVPETHAAIAALNLALRDRGWRVHRVNLGETYAVELPATWAEFERRLSKSLRDDASYDERKMRRDGDVDIRCARDMPAASWAGVVADLATIERKSWQWREGGKLRFFGDRNHAFWKSLLADSSAASVVSVWIMYFKSEPVSFCLCIDCSDVRHIVANNYSEQVRRYGTGSILYKCVFRDAIESQLVRRVNIGLGDPGYKSRWGARPSFRLVDWIAFQPGLRGRLPELAYAIRRRVRDRSADRAGADAPLPAADSA